MCLKNQNDRFGRKVCLPKRLKGRARVKLKGNLMKNTRLLGGVLLVSGTTIGAGMLVLPLQTGMAGFFSSLCLFVFIWVFMTFSAFFMLEANLWMDEDANLISMAEKTLGFWGKVFTCTSYLFLLYSLTTVYVSGGSPLLVSVISEYTQLDIPLWLGPIPFLGIFGFFVFMGTRLVDAVNRLLMLGLFSCFISLVFSAFPFSHLEYLSHHEPMYILKSFSFAVTSFGFSIIIPSLRSYLKSDIRSLKITLFIGSLIPLLVYILWEWVILSLIPAHGERSIQGAIQSNSPLLYLVQVFQQQLKDSWIEKGFTFFIFFAVVSSFLGVSLSLSDFLSDGLRIQKTYPGRMITACLTFFPPLLFSLTCKNIFMQSINYAGAFGVAVLLGLIPACMVWKGRYQKKIKGTFTVYGGRFSLLFVILTSCAVIFLTVFDRFLEGFYFL